MKSMTKALLTGSALACITVAGTTGTAHAATGRLTLISGTAGVSFSYTTCQHGPALRLRAGRGQLMRLG
ncbi:hypothetical protein AB0L65_13560 [Nonomuraea sp. NPDC052116]|uniref:hypothetical protein n=1 Tax=Nonomuraea sp. NPDC052116 TaxID=3155665 RepID=UPI00344843C5